MIYGDSHVKRTILPLVRDAGERGGALLRELRHAHG